MRLHLDIAFHIPCVLLRTCNALIDYLRFLKETLVLVHFGFSFLDAVGLQ